MPDRAVNLLLLGANRSHVRSIRALRAAGFVVTAVDDLPVALGLQAADRGVQVSPSHIKPVLAALKDIPDPDAVLFTNEEALQTAFGIADHFSLPWPIADTKYSLQSKERQRQAWNQDPNLHVSYQIVNSAGALEQAAEEIADGMVIVKPSTSRGGSRGVLLHRRGDDPTETFQEATKASLNGKVLVEKYLRGTQLSVDGVIIDRMVIIAGIGRNLKQEPPNQVNLAIEYPSSVEKHEIVNSENSVTEVVARSAEALGYREGPVHLELVDTDEGLRPIEFAARCGGGVIPDVLATRAEVHPMVQAGAIACGQTKGKIQNTRPADYPAAVIRYLTPSVEVPIESQFQISVEDQKKVVDALVFPPNDGVARRLQSTSDRWGYLAVTGRDLADCWLTIGRIGIKMADACRQPVGF